MTRARNVIVVAIMVIGLASFIRHVSVVKGLTAAWFQESAAILSYSSSSAAATSKNTTITGVSHPANIHPVPNESRLTSSFHVASIDTPADSPHLENDKNASRTTYMWYKGKPIHFHQDKGQHPRASLTIDALSVGSQFGHDQMRGQAGSWASHKSMRYLFGTTEQEDSHSTCYKDLNQTTLERISRKCRKVAYNNSLVKGMRSFFPRKQYFDRMNKTHGWLCAQKRFPHSVGKVGRFYRQEGRDMLPDYFMIGDDDTFYFMSEVTSFLQSRNQSVPFVAAGCSVEWPLHQIKFSFPFGGFGTILNRLALERLIRPIHCAGKGAAAERREDAFTEHACARLEENLVGERAAFREGMSLSDLMDRHAAILPYSEHDTWPSPGYCMMGDWILGYYINYYAIGSLAYPDLPDINYLHMDRTMGHIYSEGTGSCRNSGIDKCRESNSKYTCHRLKPDEMMEMHQLDAQITK